MWVPKSCVRVLTTVLLVLKENSVSCHTFESSILVEASFLRPAVSVLLLFATRPECTQNQTAVMGYSLTGAKIPDLLHFV
jgi:hypothetical protein